MTQLFQDFHWKNGKPCGSTLTKNEGTGYKIVADPYYRRISVEQYVDGQYVETVYDTALIDFRKLKPEHQNAWEKILVHEGKDSVISLIKDQDDRVILKETYFFKEGLCIKCVAETPWGKQVSYQEMSYQKLGGSFDGATLYDATGRVVMVKDFPKDKEDGSS